MNSGIHLAVGKQKLASSWTHAATVVIDHMTRVGLIPYATAVKPSDYSKHLQFQQLDPLLNSSKYYK